MSTITSECGAWEARTDFPVPDDHWSRISFASKSLWSDIYLTCQLRRTIPATSVRLRWDRGYDMLSSSNRSTYRHIELQDFPNIRVLSRKYSASDLAPNIFDRDCCRPFKPYKFPFFSCCRCIFSCPGSADALCMSLKARYNLNIRAWMEV